MSLQVLPRTLAHAIAQEATLDWLLTEDPLHPSMDPSVRITVYRQLAALSLRTGRSLQQAPESLELMAPPLPEWANERLRLALFEAARGTAAS